ncbi:MAG TPA: hypothetical protein VKW78_01475 [Terriglobales bacterium]|nr:hypothetical protein [Terriglobales bacterium]
MGKGRIVVEVPRTEFLRGLARLNLYGPPKPGDKIQVRLNAKLKDGTPVGANFQAVIVGEHQEAQNH